jgi:ABC-2 type transport system permease protein
MLKLLVKKQLAEVFKSYFYDAKKNKMRSKWAIAAWFIFFFLIMVGMLGGIFTFLSLSLCGALVQAGMGWLHFLLMGIIAIVLGAFGSVFNTYSGLYLAKDNDQLLSLPIPVQTIITARLLNVYLMGAMYSATVLLPALIVYWIVAGITVSRVICGLLLLLIVTVIVLLLSCFLGWVVAKISLRLKNKSFITVLISLLFIGGYYFFYFKAADLIRDLIQNANVYGTKIKGVAYGLYLFGRIGEGSWPAAALFLFVTALIFVLVWFVLFRSFLSIATDSGSVEKRRYVEKTVREKSVFGAMLGKELGKFTSNASYMLNCGLAVLLLPASGILLLLKGREIFDLMSEVFSSYPDIAAILLCTMLCMLSSMNDMAAPSVSLEGKSIWIPQSLPVESKTVLRAKVSVQLILSGLSVLFASACGMIILKTSPAVRLLVLIMPLAYSAFSALYGLVIGVKMPLLNWTSELAPIKQSGAVTIVLFSSWGFCIAFAGVYLLIGYKLGAVPYLLLWTVVFAVFALFFLKWLDTKGSRIFAEL